MFVNITEKPPWGSVIKAITYLLVLSHRNFWNREYQFVLKDSKTVIIALSPNYC